MLLSKARAIAAENKRLSEQLGLKFTSETAKRIGETTSVTHALGEWEAANEVRSFSLSLSLTVTCAR